MTKTRFIIQVGETYYMTTGKHLVYDAAKATNEDQRAGVDRVAKKFQEIHDQPHTWYKAVMLDDEGFACGNVSEE